MQDSVQKQRAERANVPMPQVSSQYTGVGLDARAVSVRVAAPRDKGKLREMFSRLSPETIHRRFHIPYRRVPERMLDLMLKMDCHAGESFLALAEGEVVGHAMYVHSEEDGEAEFAILVEDGWQSKGVGKLLLGKLAEEAERRGIEAFTAVVLKENRRVLGLLGAVFTEEVGYTALGYGLYGLRAPLGTIEPTAAQADRKPRRAA